MKPQARPKSFRPASSRRATWTVWLFTTRSWVTIPTLRFEMTRRTSSTRLDAFVATETTTNRLFIWLALRLFLAEDTILTDEIVVVIRNKVIIILFFIIEIIVTIFYWEATVVCTIGPFDWKAAVICMFFG
jgi:predicted neutral ceramidase superfamily lipid hydrolase